MKITRHRDQQKNKSEENLNHILSTFCEELRTHVKQFEDEYAVNQTLKECHFDKEIRINLKVGVSIIK